MAGASLFLWWKVRYDPNVVLLLPARGADWIKRDKPFSFEIKFYKQRGVAYRTSFTVDDVPDQARLWARALRRAEFYLDGERIEPFAGDRRTWKDPITVPLAPHCSPGRHTLVVLVFNETGPCLLQASCSELGLKTGAGEWETSLGTGEWSQAVKVGRAGPNKLSRSVGSTPAAFKSQWPFLATIFGVVFLATLAHHRGARLPGPLQRTVATPAALRWFLIGAWVLLAVNNNWKLTFSMGFDVWAHMLYIGHVYYEGTLPDAADGWQMFQTPLYYVLSALSVGAARSLFNIEVSDAYIVSRMLCHLCGIAQVELCYRALRYTFTDRDDLQSIGLLIGGLMPISLYSSQAFSNEPLAGLLAASAVVLTIAALRKPFRANSRWWQWGLALLVGLAILTKVTAVLLMPVLAVVVVMLLRQNGKRFWAVLGSGAQMACIVAVACGWYFVRNAMRFGKPFVGGWDPVRGYRWWQEPGYRTVEQFYSFGNSLVYPIYSGPTSFLDTLYSTMWLDGFLSAKTIEAARPPWQYPFMMCSPWLSVLVTVGLFVGVWVALRHRDQTVRRILTFAVACLGIYFAALLYLFLVLPIFSTAKATYTLGLLPCYALLGAAGLGYMARNVLVRAAIYGILVCWAVFAYAAYFVTMPREVYEQRYLEHLRQEEQEGRQPRVLPDMLRNPQRRFDSVPPEMPQGAGVRLRTPPEGRRASARRPADPRPLRRNWRFAVGRARATTDAAAQNPWLMLGRNSRRPGLVDFSNCPRPSRDT